MLGAIRFKNINQTLFRIAKKYAPRDRTLLRKDFLSLFYPWIPEFIDEYKKLSENNKTKYAAYVFNNGRFAEFKAIDHNYKLNRGTDNRRVRSYCPVFDMDQRKAAEENLASLFQDYLSEGAGAKEEMISESLEQIKILSTPYPTYNDKQNQRASDERKKYLHAYQYFSSRVENKVSEINILAEILWFSICGRYNYSSKDRPSPNVYIATKAEIEQDETFNLDDRCKDAKYLLLIAYAATSFLSGRLISPDCYGPKWLRFFNQLAESKAAIDIVTLSPGSFAETDAADYKMRPLTLSCPVKPANIVSINHKSLKHLITQYDLKNIHLYVTKIALPVSYVVAEFEDPSKDNIKVDLYLPIINDYNEDVDQEGKKWLIDKSRCDNTVRQSFVIYRADKSTEKLYKALRRNAEDILKASEKLY